MITVSNMILRRKKLSPKLKQLTPTQISELEIFLNKGAINLCTTHLECILDISLNPDREGSIEENYIKYKSTKKQSEQVFIRFGSIALSNLLCNKSKVSKSRNSVWSVQYWLDKGYTLDDAKTKISEMQSKNGNLAHTKKRKPREYNSMCVEYWVNRGYSEVEAASLVMERKSYFSVSLENFIKRYGEVLGPIKMAEKNAKKNATMMKKYGTTVMNGCVSKESIKFFIPLYKKLRHLGIEKEDICWGIGGSKEFAHHSDGNNFFYDFTIKSKKVVIEYNNLFWHPRHIAEWNGFGDYLSKKMYDEVKIKTLTDKGYHVIIVWNDDDFTIKYEEIIHGVFG